MDKKLVAATENELQSTVMEIMRWQGWRVYHTYDSRRSEAGYPDLTAVKGSRLMFVEFKTEKGRITVDQKDWLDQLVKACSEVYVVRPSTMDAFLLDVANLGDNLATHWKNVRLGDG